MRTQLPFAVLAAALACSLFTVSAHARARVFVASYGNDANPCTFGSPCKTFQQAVNVVDAGGEVTAIDSAGFQPVNISKAVTITSPPGVEAGIAPSPDGNAITIAAGPTDVVVLRGLTLEGAATGRTGIVFSAGGGLEIVDCMIRNFTQTGIYVGPGSFIQLLISNTRVLDNPTAGIDLEPQAGGGEIFASFDNVTVNKNGYGIFANSTVGDLRAAITNSVISNNVTGGIAETNGAGHGSAIVVKGSTISHNDYVSGESGISLSGSGASTVLLSHSLIFDNDIGIKVSGASNAFSAGDNDIYLANTPISGGSLHSIPKE
jgi:hypothetical protein